MAYRDKFKYKEMGKLEKFFLELSYPILGSLSSNMQCRFHKKFGGNNYKPHTAGAVSGATETLASLPFLLLAKDNWQFGLIGYLAAEGMFKFLSAMESETSGLPSLVGKIISLPIDIYDRIKKQYFYHPEVQKGMKNFHETRNNQGMSPNVY